ncbi:hypothetical protein NE237_017305 [Protea cynaroides]|uniref:Uncharacterized protein n=1 Tax=Protea cynaroides TaxID=273540 RepID=A0A9Q0K7R9_9MAGN|nr:hypothetical protein NE237_017305 [Protea cynaroides]
MKVNTQKDQNDSPSLEEAAGREEEDRLPRGPVEDTVEGTSSQIRLEENWIPIWVKKKRSGGSVVCAETALCPPNRFWCLNSEDDQSALAGPDGPPAASVMHPTPDPSDPLAVPNESLVSPALTSPSNSAGHIPYPPRRPSLLKRGGLTSHFEPRTRLASKPSDGSTRAQPEVTQSPLGPIAPPASSLAPNKSLFDQMRAVVHHSDVGNVVQPIGPIMNKKCPADCSESMEKERMSKGQDFHDQRSLKNGENMDLYGKNYNTHQCTNEEELMDNNQSIQRGVESEEGGQYGDPRKAISL